MVHRLERPGQPLNVAGPAPMTATLRYRCACGNHEVLQIAAAFASDVSEDSFIWTMRMLWRDMRDEVRQHLEDA